MKDIKFSIPNISKQDINLVGKIIKSGWLTHGGILPCSKMRLKSLQNLNLQFQFQAALLVYIYRV